MVVHMSTLSFVASIRPGWRIKVSNPVIGFEGGVVIQHFEESVQYAPDYDPTSVASIPYASVISGQTTIEVLDKSGEIEAEEIDGPLGGKDIEDRLGAEIHDLSHDAPVQSGPINTAVAYPESAGQGFPWVAPEPENVRAVGGPRILMVLYLPLGAATVGKILLDLAVEFPNCAFGDCPEDQIWIYEEAP